MDGGPTGASILARLADRKPLGSLRGNRVPGNCVYGRARRIAGLEPERIVAALGNLERNTGHDIDPARRSGTSYSVSDADLARADQNAEAEVRHAGCAG